MSLHDMPILPPLRLPGADTYAERCLQRTRTVQQACPVDIDRRYGEDYWQKLDVYRPPASDTPLPCLVFFHGGAWVNGFKEWMGFMAPPLLAAPAIFVAANYRLAPAVRLDAMLDDCLDAISWVLENLPAYGGDPRRVYVGGHSAGGHLAALCMLDEGRRARRNIAPGALRGCLAISAPFDLRARAAPPGHPARHAYDVLLDREEDDAAASPVTLATRPTEPFLIAYGERDLPGLKEQAAAMSEALRRHGTAVTLLEIAGADHFAANEVCGDPQSDWTRLAAGWLRDPAPVPTSAP